jgi:hypothetical protein
VLRDRRGKSSSDREHPRFLRRARVVAPRFSADLTTFARQADSGDLDQWVEWFVRGKGYCPRTPLSRAPADVRGYGMVIVDFILARVAEEERLVHQALDGPDTRDPWESDVESAHYLYWNPWRVQTACLTRRLLVKAHRNTGPVIVPQPRGHPDLVAATCETCRDRAGHPAPWPCYTLRVLASEWAHHPDYRNDWRPQRLRDVLR